METYTICVSSAKIPSACNIIAVINKLFARVTVRQTPFSRLTDRLQIVDDPTFPSVTALTPTDFTGVKFRNSKRRS